MTNQQPDHDRIIELFANSQAALRQSFIDLLQAGASIESLSGVYDAARSLEIAANNIGDDYEDSDDSDAADKEFQAAQAAIRRRWNRL